MPWAACSLGTVEYTQDLWNQDSDAVSEAIRSDNVVRSAVGMHACAQQEGSVAVRSYIEKLVLPTPVWMVANED